MIAVWPLRATARSTGALVLREMSTTYGRSPGGYLWAVLEPVGAIALMSIAFAMAFRAPSLGVSFPLFYASGFLPYLAFQDISTKLSQALKFSRPLMAYPVVTMFDALLARLTLNALTQGVVFTLVLGGCLVLFETRAILNVGLVAAAFVLAVALGAGVGTLNRHLMTAYPAWARLWPILTRPLFLISGIFFVLEDVSEPYRWWLAWNPIFHVTGLLRRGLYPGYDAAYASPLYVLVVAVVTGVLGLALLRRDADWLTA